MRFESPTRQQNLNHDGSIAAPNVIVWYAASWRWIRIVNVRNALELG